MPDPTAREIADAPRILVIAPAGCGKTHLIAAAVEQCHRRQLVLTHTHAGVRAILDHLKRRGVPKNKYSVRTIDGFALCYASSFPIIAEWNNANPSGDDWKELPRAYRRALAREAIREVVSATYSGVFIDEYQDCSESQHEMVLELA